MKKSAFDIVKEVINYKGSLPLNNTDKMVLAKIVTHMNYNIKGQEDKIGCFVGQDEIGECCGDLSDRAVRDVINKLVEYGIIATVKRYNKSNITFWIGFPEEEVVEEVPEIDESIFLPRKVIVVIGKAKKVRKPKKADVKLPKVEKEVAVKVEESCVKLPKVDRDVVQTTENDAKLPNVGGKLPEVTEIRQECGDFLETIEDFSSHPDFYKPF